MIKTAICFLLCAVVLLEPFEKPGVDVLEIKNESDPVPTRIEKKEVDFSELMLGHQRLVFWMKMKRLLIWKLSGFPSKGEK